MGSPRPSNETDSQIWNLECLATISEDWNEALVDEGALAVSI